MIFLFLALLGFLIHWAIKRKGGWNLLLLYLVFFGFGVNGLFGFLTDVVYPAVPAHIMGWQGGSPFEFETGIANLSFGILGILSVLFRGRFLLATVVGNSIWFVGLFIGHLIMSGEGLSLFYWSDLFIPVLVWLVYSKNSFTGVI